MTVLIGAETTESASTAAARIAHELTHPVRVDIGTDHGPESLRWRDQSLSKGAAGVVVLHDVLARDTAHPSNVANAWLAQATREELTAGPGAGLWFGAPAAAFTSQVTRIPSEVTHAALDEAVRQVTRRKVHAAHERMDDRQRPSQYEFDVTRGLAGIGAYLLPDTHHLDLLQEVLECLVRLTEPVDADDPGGRDVPGWWVTDQPRSVDDTQFAHGHAGFGMAHGCTGVLALLSTCLRRGVVVPGQADAIRRIRAWLDLWHQRDSNGSWWPERITLSELEASTPRQAGPLRPSWCYGTPGIARALQLAAIALREPHRQREAANALTCCVTDPVQLARLTDTNLCHGWAGLLATVQRAAADAAMPSLSRTVPYLAERFMTQLEGLQPRTEPGLIDGAAGTALVLHELATTIHPGWAACLLID